MESKVNKKSDSLGKLAFKKRGSLLCLLNFVFVVSFGNLDAERISASHQHFVFNIAV